MPAITVGLFYSLTMKHTDVGGYFFNGMKFGFWYLFVLAAFYILLLLFNLTKKYTGTKGLLIDIGLAIIVYVGISVVYYALPSHVNDLLCTMNWKRFYPAFMMGFLLRRSGEMENLMKRNWVYTLFGVAFFITYYADCHGVPHLMIPLGLFGTIFWFWVFKMREHQTSVVERELARIGRNSLDVYIFHQFFVGCINMKSLGIYCTQTNNLWIELLLLIFLSVAIAYVCMLIGWILKQSKLVNEIVYGKIANRIQLPQQV